MKTLRSTVLRVAAGLGKRLGVDVIPSWRLEHRELELHLRDIIRAYRVDAVLDVGANQGQFRSILRNHVGFEGRVISFEPVPELAKTLKSASLEDPSWTVRDCALGAFDGEQPLNVTHDTVMSSFLQPSAEAPHPRIAELSVIVRQETVPVRRLDSLWPELWQGNEPRRPFLKVDTQGWDLEVLEGAAGVLKSIPAILTELSLKPIYSNQPGYRVVLDRMEEAGFSLSGIFPVVRDPARRLIEMDCIIVKDLLAAEVAAARSGPA